MSASSSTGSGNVCCDGTTTLADEGRWSRSDSIFRTYITALGQIAVDSKFEAFQDQLNRVVADGHRVIIFTQYLDTLDFIRDRLVARYGNQLACYSGRGGEVWDAASNRWRVVEKADVKARSERDHPQAITILLGTDAASEGLNLQQFSALINYDLPWNPMRVEQRIGRIDRIGQEAPAVKILNLYMEGTIEEDTYDTLKRRIGLFEEVVGPLQPILAEMPRIFRRLARGEIELAEARRLLDEAAREKPRVAIAALEECVRQDMGTTIPEVVDPALVTQEQLAAWCLAHPAPGMRILCVPEPGMATASRVGTQGCLAITWAMRRLTWVLRPQKRFWPHSTASWPIAIRPPHVLRGTKAKVFRRRKVFAS